MNQSFCSRVTVSAGLSYWHSESRTRREELPRKQKPDEEL